jgi:hypothetical protein
MSARFTAAEARHAAGRYSKVATHNEHNLGSKYIGMSLLPMSGLADRVPTWMMLKLGDLLHMQHYLAGQQTSGACYRRRDILITGINDEVLDSDVVCWQG